MTSGITSTFQVEDIQVVHEPMFTRLVLPTPSFQEISALSAKRSHLLDSRYRGIFKQFHRKFPPSNYVLDIFKVFGSSQFDGICCLIKVQGCYNFDLKLAVSLLVQQIEQDDYGKGYIQMPSKNNISRLIL